MPRSRKYSVAEQNPPVPERENRLPALRGRPRAGARFPLRASCRSRPAPRRAACRSRRSRPPAPAASVSCRQAGSSGQRQARPHGGRSGLLHAAVHPRHQVGHLRRSALALDCAPFSMIEQNGHAITTVPAPVACSCSKRSWLMRFPDSCSSNSKPAAGAAAERIVAIAHGLLHVGAESRRAARAALRACPRSGRDSTGRDRSRSRARDRAGCPASAPRRASPSARSPPRNPASGSRGRSSSRSAGTT